MFVAQPALPVPGCAAVFIGLVLIPIGLGLASTSWPLRAIGLLLILVGVLVATAPLLVRSEALIARVTGWRPPTVEISPWPLPLGSPASVVYRRRPAKPRTLNSLAGSPDLLAELVCQEWVRYTVGSSTRTKTEDVVRLQASSPTTVITTPETELMASFALTIPVDVGGPSFSLDNNRVSWWLETSLGDPFGRRTWTKVDLIVLPVIDREAVIGEGREVQQ